MAIFLVREYRVNRLKNFIPGFECQVKPAYVSSKPSQSSCSQLEKSSYICYFFYEKKNVLFPY